MLAESEYRVQLEADIEPFKGLLLGLFFISVGASIDFSLDGAAARGDRADRGRVARAEIRRALLRSARVSPEEPAKVSSSPSRSRRAANSPSCSSPSRPKTAVLPLEIANLLMAAVALSMAAAPLLLTINDKLVRPRFQKCQPQREADAIDEHDNPVILAGFGRFGHIVGRLLRANGFGTTVLDHDADQVETLGNFGMKSFYGDASRLDLLAGRRRRRARSSSSWRSRTK